MASRDFIAGVRAGWNSFSSRLSSRLQALFRLITATALAQAVGIVASPILTRLYSPDDFGTLTVFIGVVGSISTISALRYEVAIPLPKDAADGKSVLALSTVLVALISSCVAIFLWTAQRGAMSVPALEPILPYWWLVGASVAGYGFYRVLSQWAIREQAYPILARTRIQQGLGQVLTQLGAGLAGTGVIGLLAGQVVGSSAGVGALSRSLRQSRRLQLHHFRSGRLFESAKRFRRFPLMSAPSAFLDSLGLALPSLLLSAYYDTSVAGWYGLTVRVAGLPMTVIGHAIANVYLGEVAEIVRSEPTKFKSFFGRALSKTAVFGFLGVFIPLVLGSYAIPLVFGSAWTGASRYLRILAPLYASQFIATAFGATLEVVERQDLHLVREIVRTSMIALALWYGPSAGKTATWTIGLFSVAGVGGYAVYLWMSVVAVNYWHGKQYADKR